MEIRAATSRDRNEIVSMYVRSQSDTGLPDPLHIPSTELGDRLYARHAIERYVAEDGGQIIGHGLIEQPNPANENIWRNALGSSTEPLIEMGGAFVEPRLGRQGIWSSLLLHRIEVIRSNGAIPVTATWSLNDHVKRRLEVYGGMKAGSQRTQHGDVDLFVFP